MFALDVGGGGVQRGVVDRNSDVMGFDDTGELHVHGFDDGFGCDVVFLVVGELLVAASISFADGLIHGAGARVGVEDGAARDVASAAAHRLYQRGRAAQVTFLFGVENGDQRNTGGGEAFPQKIYSGENTEFSAPQ